MVKLQLLSCQACRKAAEGYFPKVIFIFTEHNRVIGVWIQDLRGLCLFASMVVILNLSLLPVNNYHRRIGFSINLSQLSRTERQLAICAGCKTAAWNDEIIKSITGWVVHLITMKLIKLCELSKQGVGSLLCRFIRTDSENKAVAETVRALTSGL